MNKYVCLSIWTLEFVISFNVLSAHSADESSGSSDWCFRDDPKIDVCLRKRINDVVEQFHKGKDDFGLREVDPLAIEEPLHFEHKARLIGGKISVKNMMNEGLTSVKVQSLRSKLQNPNKMEVGFSSNFKSIVSTGQYLFKGYLGRIPINANGRYNITFKDVETSYLLKAKLKEIENSTFLQLESFLTHPPKFGDIKVFASELVPGNAVLNRVALRFVNQYATQITDELFPVVGPVLDEIQRDMCNKMLTKYPFDILLPATKAAS